MRTCPACQETLPEDSLFCGICGFRLTPLAPTASVATGQDPLAGTGSVVPLEAQSIAEAATAPAGMPGCDIPEYRSGMPPRRSQRFPLKVDVNYSSEHNFYTGFLQNVSSGGLFVATHHLAQIGETIGLVFSIPGWSSPCEVNCQVTWVREHHVAGPDTSPGMGLRFLNLDASAADAIDVFIRHREPIFFEE